MDIMGTDAQPQEAVPAEALRSVHKLLWNAITDALNPSERDEVGFSVHLHGKFQFHQPTQPSHDTRRMMK